MDGEDDQFSAQWCCMTCNTKFPVGDMYFSQIAPGFLECPHCRSLNTHPATGEVTVLDEYTGRIPAVKN